MSESAVLLPLRLETRFVGKSRLRLRVVPDDPWLTRHEPRPSEAEVTALRRFADHGDRAEFAASVSAPRAAFLARTYLEDGRVAEKIETSEDPVFPRILGFPAELMVWLAAGGSAPEHVHTLKIDNSRLDLDLPRPGEVRWWSDWDEAVRVGLAAEIEIPGPQIDLLVVTGLGVSGADALFGRHRDAGTLGLVAPGTPTNTVAGAPAADLARDVDAWFSPGEPGESDHLVSAALTGDRAFLGALPGGREAHRSESTAMVTALWPALWGFAATDVWGMPRAREAGAWARAALFPQGPFPTLRIGAQPYALLPATSLSRWLPADPKGVEGVLSQPLTVLRDRWQAAAEGRGTVAGKDTDGLLDLIGQTPSSGGYRHRKTFPLELWWLSALLVGGTVNFAELDQRWREAYRLSGELGLDPFRRYGARGRSRPLRLPLIAPDGVDVAAALGRIAKAAETTPSAFGDTVRLASETLKSDTAGLLLRLVIRALQVALGDIGREAAAGPAPALEPLTRPASTQGRLESWILRATPALVAGRTPAATACREVIAAVRALALIPRSRLERMLPATVDTALYRIDPWVLGPPTRRLLEGLDSAPVLGAYGWVEDLRPGNPGPTPAGLLHAPSPEQALTAAILRDRAVADPEADRWRLDLTSRKIRDAVRLAGQVAEGAHLSEVLGREVERIAGSSALVAGLRRDFPIRPAHAGRRVCDGLAVLAVDPPGLSAAQRSELAALRDAVDAYGDLLVAESVHHLTQRRSETAGAVLDAASGLTRPPNLDVIRTPRRGRGVSTSVLVAIPAADPAGGEIALRSPSAVADPAAAAFVAAHSGDAQTWKWTARGPDGPVTVTAADLGLTPADALSCTSAALEGLVLRVTKGEDLLEAGGSARHAEAVRLVTLLGRAPAGPDATSTRPDLPPDPDGLAADLRERYDRLITTAKELLSLPDPAAPAVVAAYRRWGILTDPAAAPDLLAARLAAAPPGQGLAPDALLTAITGLASPTGILAVLSSPQPQPATAPADLDLDWLTIVATVRPALTRLEAHRLSAERPLVARTNKPDDPWQKNATDPARLVVVYGPEDLDPDHPVALTALDRWAEVIPDHEHTTGAAFGFDAPAARAPQAILLAVPPDPAARLDAQTILESVLDTRRMAHARMARPADLGPEPSGLLPTALLPATGRTAVPLDSKG